jgi:hypothetical protein
VRKSSVYFLATSLLCNALVAQTVKPPFDNQGQAGKWFSEYYKHPQPDLIPAFFRFFDKNNQGKRNDGVVFGMAGWLAGVFDSDPTSTAKLAKILVSIKGVDERVIGYAILLSSQPNRIDIAKSIFHGDDAFSEEMAQIISGSPKSLLQLNITAPPDLDMRWGYFMATGKEDPVIQVISVLPCCNLEMPKEDVKKTVLIGAAKWSLTSNAIQYPRVLNICEKELAKRPTREVSHLSEVVKNAKAGPVS